MGIRTTKIDGVDIPIMERTDSRYRQQFYSRRGTYNRGFTGRDYAKYPVGSSPYAEKYPEERKIDTSEWKDRIAEIGKTGGLFAIQRSTGTPTLNQSHTNYCWGAAVLGACHTKRAYNNGRHIADLSNASVCAPVKGFRNVGGFCLQWIEYASENGIGVVDDWPFAAIDRRYQEAAAAERVKHKPEKFLDLPYKDPEAIGSELLRENPLGIELPWWGHAVEAVMLVDLSFMGESWPGVLIRNSHGDAFGANGYCIITWALWKVIQGGACLLSMSDAEAVEA